LRSTLDVPLCTVYACYETSELRFWPYRWVRHPFYVCAALVTMTVSLVSANAFFLATGGLIFLLLALRTRVEEANLLSRSGEDYRKYRDRTGRFCPRF
jgi:protein-S-isoprenylcysteine O-methyltransferase Ste14